MPLNKEHDCESHPNDDEGYQFEQLRTSIRTDDSDEGSGKQVFPQFNEIVGFDDVYLELGIKFSTMQMF